MAVFVLGCTVFAAQALRPERLAEGNRITSQHDPAVRIRLPNGAQYAGADRFVLYEIADCELHAWVEADRNRNVQRLYWVQFESYLPSRPELHHTYDSPRHTQIGGMDFYVDTWVRSKSEKTQPGSDREHIVALVESKGYHMPDGMMYVRLVHLLDEQKRKELMVIYAEDLQPKGLTASELQQGGSAYSQWAAIDRELVTRAEKSIAIEPLQ